jgi:delta 1-pyrroline-5-carboxylate dehydrogenase
VLLRPEARGITVCGHGSLRTNARGIDIQNLERTQKLNTKRTNVPNNKWANEQTVLKSKVQMVKKYMKKCQRP